DRARQHDALGPGVAEIAVVREAPPAAPLLRVLGDRAAVVRGAGRADAHARLRDEAAERREERRDLEEALGVRLDARLEELRERVLVGATQVGRRRGGRLSELRREARGRVRRVGPDAL